METQPPSQPDIEQLRESLHTAWGQLTAVHDKIGELFGRALGGVLNESEQPMIRALTRVDNFLVSANPRNVQIDAGAEARIAGLEAELNDVRQQLAEARAQLDMQSGLHESLPPDPPKRTRRKAATR